jgi:glycosyltransferase involved in cell wall biosynthesis
MKKIYIISDEILIENQKWICDRLKDQFIENFPKYTTKFPEEAEYIWYIAPWNYNHVPDGYSELEWKVYLQSKKVIATIHHIDIDNLFDGKYRRQFKFIRKYATLIHSICPQTTQNIEKYCNLEVPIITKYLWVKDQQFYPMNCEKKMELKRKYRIGNEVGSFVVGNFQNDKTSKAPEIFLNIILDMIGMGRKIEVVLCGRNRKFLTEELDKKGVKYHYYQMVALDTINELYNCLDLYIVSSRYEGGPRSIIECALTRTPLISTKVGIAPEFMDENSLFDIDNWTTYKNATPNPDILVKNIAFLRTEDYMDEFRTALFP